nr:MAG TPA: hypothetical protein [Caudoviricetes sp.]
MSSASHSGQQSVFWSPVNAGVSLIWWRIVSVPNLYLHSINPRIDAPPGA